jgi:hypothetical protein
MTTVWLVTPGADGRTMFDITDRTERGALVGSVSLTLTDDDLVDLMGAFMDKLIAHDPGRAHTFLVAAARGLDEFETGGGGR